MSSTISLRAAVRIARSISGWRAKRMLAALLIFQGESAAAAEAFARQDPYIKNGLVTKWKVRNWTVVVGNEPRPPFIEKRAAESA